MTDAIDGYLSRLAQQVEPRALVVQAPEGWLLRVPGREDVRLGTEAAAGFGDAKSALQAWMRVQKDRSIELPAVALHGTPGDASGSARMHPFRTIEGDPPTAITLAIKTFDKGSVRDMDVRYAYLYTDAAGLPHYGVESESDRS